MNYKFKELISNKEIMQPMNSLCQINFLGMMQSGNAQVVSDSAIIVKLSVQLYSKLQHSAVLYILYSVT